MTQWPLISCRSTLHSKRCGGNSCFSRSISAMMDSRQSSSFHHIVFRALGDFMRTAGQVMGMALLRMAVAAQHLAFQLEQTPHEGRLEREVNFVGVTAVIAVAVLGEVERVTPVRPAIHLD